MKNSCLVHQIWFQGEENIPVKYLIFQKTWESQLGIDYRFWDKARIDQLMGTVSVAWNKTYLSFPTMIQKIDFAKYVILFIYGGVYLDMDIFAVRPITDFLNRKDVINLDFIVFKHNSQYITILANRLLGLSGNILINNAVIFSTAKNEKLEKIINTCCASQNNWKKFLYTRQARCLVTTGPIMFTNTIKAFDKWEHYTLSSKVFEPYTTLEMVTLMGAYAMNDYMHDEEKYSQLMQLLKHRKDMTGVIGIHVLDLNWCKNRKENWKFKVYLKVQNLMNSINR